MEILTSKEKQILDSDICEKENIESIVLMERVALNIASNIVNKLDLRKKSFLIVCGQGNNGGDGLAIARILCDIKVNVKVAFLNFSKKISNNCNSNLILFQEKYPQNITILNSAKSFSADNYDIIIDAIFGIGLNKTIDGEFAEIIHKINYSAKKSKTEILSIDIPSGLFGEDNSKNNDTIITANKTFFVNTPPLSAMFPENYQYFGHLIKIKLSNEKIVSEIIEKKLTKNDNEISFHIIDDNFVAKIFPIRNDFFHKNNFGHPLLIAGNYEKAGAAILAAKACFKSGVGLLSAYIAKSLRSTMQIAVPEIMTEIDSNENFISFNNINTEKYSCYGIGPGLGTNQETITGLTNFLSRIKEKNDSKIRLVIDADGLNCLSKIENFQKILPANTILTPHPKELERLFGSFNNTNDKINYLLNFCKKTKTTIILKNAITTIICPDNKVYFNIAINSAMAKAGTGDILTGILTAFQAQYENPIHNAILAVYLHSIAGKIAGEKKGKFSTNASDIIDNLNEAFKKFEILNNCF